MYEVACAQGSSSDREAVTEAATGSKCKEFTTAGFGAATITGGMPGGGVAGVGGPEGGGGAETMFQ